ncbi:MAG: OmpA family protein [Gammaproteobacteria bacterium]|nr:OmpA family protein [Gammaproteobacteria bacterium]MDH3766971.1 OmpA family protein [Gammaproteobacteria bacterium]
MNQAVIVATAVLAFLVLAISCMRSHGPAIEAELHARAIAAIENAGMSWVQLSADGRTVTMNGVAPNAAMRHEAAELLTAVRGIRSIDNEMQVPDEDLSPVAVNDVYETRLEVTPGSVRFTGFAPDEETREVLVNRTRELFPKRRVQDEMAIRKEAPDNWLDAMTNLQRRFTTYASAEAVIRDNRLNVVGTVAPGRDGETKLLASRMPANFMTEINLGVAPTESAQQCQRRLDELMQEKINFEEASEVIEVRSFQLLDQLVDRIRGCGGLRIEVSGHTDSEGLVMKNLELSQRRAEAIVEYLVGAGIDADQLIPWGYGESQPIADNSTNAGRAENRRIEFHALN